jgi:4-hydroxy-3-methylbut-2-enyl diphosphate reductase
VLTAVDESSKLRIVMAVKKVVLAKPRGFCAGVEMALATVERALEKHGPPLYVFHEIVHNRHVVRDFIARGVHFVQSIDEVPSGARMIFSAHGISPEVWQQAKQKQLAFVIDATCPLVDKVHREVRKFASQGYGIILVGYEKHDEIVGTSGEAPQHVRIVANRNQADDTREIIDVLKERFPKIIAPAKEDICYATQNRQDAVKQLTRAVDLVLVIGSENSENSNQLCAVARSQGTPAYLIGEIGLLDPSWLNGVTRVGITSGASVPERLVDEAVDFFKQQGAEISHLGFVEENIHFALPTEIVHPQ